MGVLKNDFCFGHRLFTHSTYFIFMERLLKKLYYQLRNGERALLLFHKETNQTFSSIFTGDENRCSASYFYTYLVFRFFLGQKASRNLDLQVEIAIDYISSKNNLKIGQQKYYQREDNIILILMKQLSYLNNPINHTIIKDNSESSI